MKLLKNQESLCRRINPAPRIRRMPARLESSVVMYTVGNPQQPVHDKSLFRQNVYISIIDCLISGLDGRFSAQSNAAMPGIQALYSWSSSVLDIDTRNNFAKCYHASMEDIGHEIHQ